MRAALITEHARPPVLGERPIPVPAEDEALVEVTAAPVTPLDVLTASGTSYFGPPALPYVPGVQGVGRLVDDPSVRVWFTTDAGMKPGDGSMSERAAVPRERMWVIPVDVPDEQVAGLGLSAVAAHGALRRGRFEPGARVLVLGAGGVVGRVAVQLARAWGAGLVVAAARGEQSGRRARALGAHAAVDVSGGDPRAMVRDLGTAAPEGFDLVVDPVWGAPARAALEALAPGGRLVNLGDAAGALATFPSSVVRSRSVQILGYTNVARPWVEQTEAMGEVLRLAAAGQVQLEVETVPFSDAAQGWSRQVERRAHSRVVIQIGPE